MGRIPSAFFSMEGNLAMIRLAKSIDLVAILRLAVETGMFPADGTEELAEILGDYFAGNLGDEHVWLVDDEQGVRAVAYYAPERMTSGTFNLYMIAVRPDWQRQGLGAALIRQVEQRLAAVGGRLLLVETSSLADYVRAQNFYQRCGFEKEAQLRDFYDAGNDKIVFRKAITA